jgi:hypothetical protein
MATKKSPHSDETTELIRTMVIIQLGLAGVPQRNIRTIAGCDMNRVNRILKYIKPKVKKD